MIPPVDDVSLQSHFDLLVRLDSGGLLPADEYSSNLYRVLSIKNYCLSSQPYPDPRPTHLGLDPPLSLKTSNRKTT